ncbi:MAG TPA: hypothetical protein VG937_02085 [Polyangiaceae bacterium]|nr:hypothetical protein [Polyangiaceae bacterium]
MRPLKLVQQKLGLRLLSHHKVGRHSMASRAVTGGESIKAVQAQLGHVSWQSTHKYAPGLGRSVAFGDRAQTARAPHDDEPPREAHVNRMSTAAPSATKAVS